MQSKISNPCPACGTPDALTMYSLNEEIPESLYRVIAEILAFAFHIRGLTPEDRKPGAPDDSVNQ